MQAAYEIRSWLCGPQAGEAPANTLSLKGGRCYLKGTVNSLFRFNVESADGFKCAALICPKETYCTQAFTGASIGSCGVSACSYSHAPRFGTQALTSSGRGGVTVSDGRQIPRGEWITAEET